MPVCLRGSHDRQELQAAPVVSELTSLQAKQAKWHNIKGSMLSWLHRDTLPWNGGKKNAQTGEPDLPQWSKQMIQEEEKRKAAEADAKAAEADARPEL